jgi:hypothetical protein
MQFFVHGQLILLIPFPLKLFDIRLHSQAQMVGSVFSDALFHWVEFENPPKRLYKEIKEIIGEV